MSGCCVDKRSFSKPIFVLFYGLTLLFVFTLPKAMAALPQASGIKYTASQAETVQYYNHRRYWCEIIRKRVWDPYIGRWVITEQEVCHKRRRHY